MSTQHEYIEITRAITDSVNNAVGHQTQLLFNFLTDQIRPLMERVGEIEKFQAECPARQAADKAKDEIKQIFAALWNFAKWGIIVYIASKVLNPKTMEVLNNVMSQIN